MKALSIRQPWAWLIVYGGKDVENRTWKTNYRGPVLIHASKTLDVYVYNDEFLKHTAFNDVVAAELRIGGIIGIADLVDCVTESDSEWFTGPYGFVLENVKSLPFKAMRGRLGLFAVEWQEVTE